MTVGTKNCLCFKYRACLASVFCVVQVVSGVMIAPITAYTGIQRHLFRFQLSSYYHVNCHSMGCGTRNFRQQVNNRRQIYVTVKKIVGKKSNSRCGLSMNLLSVNICCKHRIQSNQSCLLLTPNEPLAMSNIIQLQVRRITVSTLTRHSHLGQFVTKKYFIT